MVLLYFSTLFPNTKKVAVALYFFNISTILAVLCEGPSSKVNATNLVFESIIF